MPYPLLPYKRHTVWTLTGMIDDYICMAGSYYEMSSGAALDYGDHVHVLFYALERLLDWIPWIEEWLQKVRFGRGESMWRAERATKKECPNAWKARKPGKEEKLKRARTAMELMHKLMGEVSFAEEVEKAARQLMTAPFSMLTSARVVNWFIPHKRELALL